MRKCDHLLGHVADDDFLVRQHGDAGAQLKQRVQIVRHHHHRQAHALVQRAQQRDETVGAFRVQPGSGFVEQQQRRVHREGACQCHALDHAARQITRHFVGYIGFQADHLQLDHGGFTNQPGWQGLEFTQRKRDVLKHGECRKKRALLKQHAHLAGRVAPAEFGDGSAQHRDLAFRRVLQPQHLAQQHGFAGARTADQRQHLAAHDAQVQVLVDHGFLVTVFKHGPELFDFDDGFGHIPIFLKSTANSASTRITTVIDVTTDAVVPCPRLSVFGFTRRP